MDKIIQLNSKLQEFKSSRDDRFVHCKILVCHDQENLNGSFFNSEVQMRCAEKTIRGIPLLANVYKDDEDNWRVGGHDIKMEILDTSEGFEIENIYLEKPVGFVPEDTILSTEEIDGKKYLSCTGVIWRTYSEQLLDILDKNNGSLNVSMEISCEDMRTNENGYLEILSFSFLGITILGLGIEPAMSGANVSVFSKEIQNELAELKKAYSEGGEKMEDVKDTKVEELEEEEIKEVEEVCSESKEESCVNEKEDIKDDEYTQLKEEYENLKEKYSELQLQYNELDEQLKGMSDYAELKEFKDTYDKAKYEKEVNDVLDMFGLDESETKELTEKALNKEFTIDEFKKELALVYSMKQLESKKKDFAKEEDKEPQVEIIDKEQRFEKLSSEAVIEKHLKK